MNVRRITYRDVKGANELEFVLWLNLIIFLLATVFLVSAYSLVLRAKSLTFGRPAEAGEFVPLYKTVLDQFHKEAGAELGMSANTFKTYMNVLAYIQNANPNLSQESREEMGKAIVKYSQQYELPVGLVVGVVDVESTFRADAVGRKTYSGRAKGPMQVMWPLHKDLAHSLKVNSVTILTADGGVKVGCYLLRRYIQHEKSILGGLVRYFSAPSRRYVLDAVLTTYLAFEQAEYGLISIDQIPTARKNEIKAMKDLTKKGR